MNFTDILKLVKIKKKINGEICMICYFPINERNLITLSCSHKYHKDCLYTNKKNIECPYCLKNTKLKKCRKCYNYKIKNSDCDKCKNNMCKHILKTGKNKGKECGKNNCKIHKKKTCQIILKSGKRKGQLCNRINCRYHKKNIII